MDKLTAQDFINMENGVVDFNKAMGNCLSNKGLISTYQALSVEEICDELQDAIKEDDKIEILDALIDGVFVVFYWALLDSSENSLIEDPSYLLSICDRGVDGQFVPDVKLLCRSIEEGSAFNAQTYLLEVILHYQDKFDIRGAYKEVHRSNMSKFILKGSVDIQEEIDYIISAGRYEDITVSEVTSNGEVYLCFKAGRDVQSNVTYDSPKMIKTRCFSEPQLEQFIL